MRSTLLEWRDSGGILPLLPLNRARGCQFVIYNDLSIPAGHSIAIRHLSDSGPPSQVHAFSPSALGEHQAAAARPTRLHKQAHTAFIAASYRVWTALGSRFEAVAIGPGDQRRSAPRRPP